GDDGDALARVARAAYDAERSAIVASRCERARIAMGQHGRAIGQQFAAEAPERAIGFDVLFEDRLRFVNQTLLDLFHVLRLGCGAPESFAHALNSPEQID